jgi:hypothetical protein
MKDSLPEGQSGTEENDRRSSREGATESGITCESGAVFQNYALKHYYYSGRGTPGARGPLN